MPAACFLHLPPDAQQPQHQREGPRRLQPFLLRTGSFGYAMLL